MQGPRPPKSDEWSQVVHFLNEQLRPQAQWSITTEYPTALNQMNLPNMRIITEDSKIVSHALLKPFILKTPLMILKVGAVGSVVTDSNHRNQGLGAQIILECLSEAQRQDCDISILWTDKYDYYRKLNFELAGFEESFVINKEIPVEKFGLKFLKTSNISPEAILRLYNQHTISTFRTQEDIRKFLQIPATQVYSAWDLQGQLVAYAIEGKGADLSGYIHEWGGSVSKLLALLSWIYREKQKPFTLIMPFHALNLKMKLEQFSFKSHPGYLGMIRIVNGEQFLTKLNKAVRLCGVTQVLFSKRGHNYSLQIRDKNVTFHSERDFVQYVFGPTSEIHELSQEENQLLSRVVPLPLWIWGWDSV